MTTLTAKTTQAELERLSVGELDAEEVKRINQLKSIALNAKTVFDQLSPIGCYL